MPSVFATPPAATAIPITFATKATWDAVCAGLPGEARQFALANGFAAKPGACLTLPAADGAIAHVVFGLEDAASKFRDLFRPGLLPGLLPPGVYRFANAPHDSASPRSPSRSAPIVSAATESRMRPTSGCCRLTALTSPPSHERPTRHTLPATSSIRLPTTWGRKSWRWRPQRLAQRFGANFGCIVGDDLTRQNFPLIHAVGMASPRAPRLIDLTWGDAAIPR